jgi:REP element-mobilizing transposase RayT
MTTMDDFHSYRRDLPHWRLAGSIYFLTWRLATGMAPLSGDERQVVAEAIRHFDGDRYALHAFVVMDDHVHVLVSVSAGLTLERIVHSWKSFTSHKLVQEGRRAPVWQREYYDRIVRDEAELLEKGEYIVGNPTKRWPATDAYPWVWAVGQ